MIRFILFDTKQEKPTKYSDGEEKSLWNSFVNKCTKTLWNLEIETVYLTLKVLNLWKFY